ncbi:DDE-type integrase/transposase/recombinase [Rhodococcus sp. IEGM 1409]|uniref:DDE-type integrase/transposase/recombinase n=1 Tax=Rhodococcus sp. IEGM 1409 TaxID=3047082 RepID=UPI0024B80253|nr:DDE-type integrase/transposase/recombinase [Rhodococcus sp. IEGM 1409]MDI9903935.1 DDE-type integrase/transposase/recombinase [Rhodococcus sp. IEGM 1409]
MTRRREMLSPAVLVAITDRAAGRKVNVAALCRNENLSSSWFYQQLGRFTRGGLEALAPRSSAPHTRPSTTPPGVVEAIVRARKDLQDEGSDNGPYYIRQRLIADGHANVPSESTIYRHLKSRGQILAQPNKRPNSYRRFEYPAPNACWQIDGTHLYLADRTRVTVVEIIDDHSRLCVASHAAVTESFESAWAALQSGFIEFGLPAMILSDNGTAFSGRRRGTISELERELAALGIVAITSSIAHPQTCGKIERHHQTMKRWIAARPPAVSLQELQILLDAYRRFYNNRPQKTLGSVHPAARWAATSPAGPDTAGMVRAGSSARPSSPTGVIKIHGLSIHLGRAWGNRDTVAYWQGDRYAVFVDDELARELVVDRTHTRQLLNPRKQ